ncbi:MAG TPA: serine/threonine-protein kinase [Polyangiaceae bacterium]|jgi:serine/threonine protein kinase|nr:serine/threonine-protein kinase [Polyangiaceae bacterium]
MSLLLLTQGVIFAGDYEIVGLLAEGGMGAVYVARQLSTGKDRALKIMQPSLMSDERTRERFTREARAASQVNSEHVIEVVAAGIDAQTGMPWLAMELLRGEDLESFAIRLGPLPVAQVLEIFRQLCHGLAAAHATGLVHRDLKPENVYLATARRVGVPFTVKILDFGIAKIVHETKRDVTDAVGTPTWMAPEQTEAGKAITPASDVWALGLIAFRLLIGFPYWRSANAPDVSAMAILREVVFDTLEPASMRARELGSTLTLPPDFDAWFASCVDREAGKRLQNATDALAGLERVLGQAAPARIDQMYAPVEAVPATRGEPHGEGPAKSEPGATRVGPFTGELHRYPESAPPSVDVDTYERGLSRGKVWAWAAGGALLVALGAGAWHFRARTGRGAPFTGVEAEPNNRAPDANLLPFGEKMRGQIGQRLDAERSDRDFFRTTVPPGANAVRVAFHALPNIAPCILVYRGAGEEPLLRYCVGQPARDLVIPALRLEPSEYLFAVLQDREQYEEAPPPPVLENVSDAYELTVGPGTPEPDAETEPNDGQASANMVAMDGSIRARLAWMRDVDVFCTNATEPVRFVVEDASPRPHGAVLEVTPIGPGGPGDPVRVHHAAAKGNVTERDVKSPYAPAKHKGHSTPATCVSVTLTADIWATPPLPRVAPAGDQEYVVRVESLAGG